MFLEFFRGNTVLALHVERKPDEVLSGGHSVDQDTKL